MIFIQLYFFKYRSAKARSISYINFSFRQGCLKFNCYSKKCYSVCTEICTILNDISNNSNVLLFELCCNLINLYFDLPPSSVIYALCFASAANQNPRASNNNNALKMNIIVIFYIYIYVHKFSFLISIHFPCSGFMNFISQFCEVHSDVNIAYVRYRNDFCCDEMF